MLVIVLTVLLILAAMVILWNFYIMNVKKSSEKIDINPFLLSATGNFGLVSDGTLNVTIKRDSGGVEISGIKFIFNFPGSSYYNITTTNLPKAFESKTYNFRINDLMPVPSFSDFSTLEKVNAYFIYTAENGEQRISPMKIEISGSNVVCSRKTCFADYPGNCGSALDDNCGGSLDCSDSCEFVFTTCGASGNSGPSQANCDSVYNPTNLNGNVNVVDGIQFWTVPIGVSSIRINVSGASGGYNNNPSVGDAVPGKGANMSGVFSVTGGQILAILVGQSPGLTNTLSATGGGGGSFVAISSSAGDYASATPLIVAGGGGAGYRIPIAIGFGVNAPTTNDGTGPYPGTGGNGGDSQICGGAGGGFYTSGGNSSTIITTGGMGGAGFRQGGLGGSRNPIIYQSGGFGGGSEAQLVSSCQIYAGSGGGYSGGSGGVASNPFFSKFAGDAGGSYNNGISQRNRGGANLGDGRVVIRILG